VRREKLTFEGTPKEIGEAYGESLRGEIGELYTLRLENALAQAKEYGGRDVGETALLELSKKCLPKSEAYDPEGFAELEGIARGSRLPIEKIFAMNGLTDLRDVLAYGDPELWAAGDEGCSAFVVAGDRTEDGRMYLGQTWDLATDNMPFVVLVERKPRSRPSTLSMTTAGCLSLIGLDDEGVAIGTTNLRSKDSRAGVTYLQIIHRALREAALAGVERAVVDAPRAGAHYYYAADASEHAVGLECTATRVEARRIASGSLVHCNHVLEDANKPLEASKPVKSTVCRQARMAELIGGHERPLTVADLMRFLADHEGGEYAICRHDLEGTSSNGSMIMCPKTRRAWMCHGPACTGVWLEATFGR
jgi:isopenicillin-N N-acyltransferase like protein